MKRIKLKVLVKRTTISLGGHKHNGPRVEIEPKTGRIRQGFRKKDVK